MPGGPVSAAGNTMLRDFAIRAIEAQPVSYAHVIVNGLVLSVDWKRYNYPSKGTVYDYYFHTQPQTVPYHTWIPGGTARQDIQAYGHQSISRVVKPFAYLMSGYERVFYLYGPLFGLILLLGLGSIIRVTRRSGGGIRLGAGGTGRAPCRGWPPWCCWSSRSPWPTSTTGTSSRSSRSPAWPRAWPSPRRPPRPRPSSDAPPSGAEAPIPAPADESSALPN